MELDSGSVISDRYTVESVLGEGGMAMVYRATHNQLGTAHAVKVLSLNSRPVRERLLQEGRVQASLQHPNIVAVTDVVEVQGSPALVMELIEGPSLDDLIRQQKLTIDQADAIGRGILAGVAHAHDRSLIHRDLKPANVMLHIGPDGVVPKVTDFGLAKILRGDAGKARTKTGATMGTPQYMSPEQIKDAKNLDARSDVYAVGAILYELVTGDRAFDGDNLLEIFGKVAKAEYIDPKSLRADAPERMLRAIEAALVVDRDTRVASCRALYEIWTDGEPMPAASFSPEQLADLAASMLHTSPPPLTRETDTFAEPATSVVPAASLAPTLVVGGGVLTLLLGVVAILLFALLAVGLWWATSEPQVVMVDRHRTVVVPASPETPDAPVPTAPRPTVDPDEPVVEAPDPAVEPSAPSPEPPEPAVDPDAVVDAPVPWNDLPDDMREPDYQPEPVVPEPVEPVPEPEPVEPDVAEPPAMITVPMSFRSGPRESRKTAVDRARDDPTQTRHLVTVYHASNDYDLRKAAFGALMHQFESGIGDASVLTREAERGIADGPTWFRRRGLEAWAIKGTSLQVPAGANKDAQAVVRILAARAVGAVGLRTNQRDEAKRILAAAGVGEGSSRVIKELEKQTKRLNR